MSIALTTHYAKNYSRLGDLTSTNKREYCDKYGYQFHEKIEENHSFTFGFGKIQFVLDLFKQYNYDYIHFSGVDAWIMNFNIKIEDFIDNQHDFFIAKYESGDYRCINADAFIVKNSENGIKILEFILSKKEEYKNDGWQEQRVMIHNFDNPPYNSWVKIMPHQSFNSTPWKFYDSTQSGNADVHNGEPGDFKLGDFLLHCAGHNLENRIRIFNHYKNQIIK